MPFAEFAVHTDVVTGLGSLERLEELLARHGASRPAVSVDAALADNGLLDVILSHAPRSRPVCVSRFPVNPDVAAVERAVAEAKAAGADSVIAVGGGSALGASKAVGILLTNEGSISDYEGVNRVPVAAAPIIAVPTTAGSGSEVSNALVLHEPGRPRELVVRGRGCEPRGAILDGRLLRGLPERPFLYASLDALTHAMEALWARGGSYFTTALALHAADRILTLLPDAIAGTTDGRNQSGANDAVLQELLEASCAANVACGNSALGLVHALSSSMHVDLPHGLQNGVLLPFVAGFNAATLPPEARELPARIEALYAHLGFVPSFTAVSDSPVSADAMVATTVGHPFRANNRREPTDDELRELVVAAGAR